MSRVYSYVILLDGCEDDDLLDLFNSALVRISKTSIDKFSDARPQFDKGMEAGLWACGGNYLAPNDVSEALRTIKFKSPECVHAFVFEPDAINWRRLNPGNMKRLSDG